MAAVGCELVEVDLEKRRALSDEVEVVLGKGDRAPLPPQAAAALLLRLGAEVVAGELLVVHLHSDKLYHPTGK